MNFDPDLINRSPYNHLLDSKTEDLFQKGAPSNFIPVNRADISLKVMKDHCSCNGFFCQLFN